MGYSRQKTVMYIVSTTSLLAILGALYAFRDGLVESWYLYRLNSNDVTTREKCIGQLSRLHSARAVPKLIELAAASMTLSKRLTSTVCPLLICTFLRLCHRWVGKDCRN